MKGEFVVIESRREIERERGGRGRGRGRGEGEVGKVMVSRRDVENGALV